MTETQRFERYDWRQQGNISSILVEKYVKPVSQAIEDLKNSEEYKKEFESFKNEFEDDEVKRLKEELEEANKYKGLSGKVYDAVKKVLKGTKFEKGVEATIYVEDSWGDREPIEHVIPGTASVEGRLENYYVEQFDSKHIALLGLKAKRSLMDHAISSVLDTTSMDTPAQDTIQKTEELLRYLELID